PPLPASAPMIRRAETDADFELCARIKNAVQPAEPVTARELQGDPQARLLIHGEAGYAIVKPSSLARCAFTMVRVLPGARRRGVGAALLGAASAEARALGLESLFGRVDGDDAESLAFLLRRGFVEIGWEVEQVPRLAPDRRHHRPTGCQGATGAAIGRPY